MAKNGKKPDAIHAGILEVLVDVMGPIDDANCTATASLRDDLGLDSLDVVELAMALEEKFKLDVIEDSDVIAWVNLGDVDGYLRKRGAKCHS